MVVLNRRLLNSCRHFKSTTILGNVTVTQCKNITSQKISVFRMLSSHPTFVLLTCLFLRVSGLNFVCNCRVLYPCYLISQLSLFLKNGTQFYHIDPQPFLTGSFSQTLSSENQNIRLFNHLNSKSKFKSLYN